MQSALGRRKPLFIYDNFNPFVACYLSQVPSTSLRVIVRTPLIPNYAETTWWLAVMLTSIVTLLSFSWSWSLRLHATETNPGQRKLREYVLFIDIRTRRGASIGSWPRSVCSVGVASMGKSSKSWSILSQIHGKKQPHNAS